jgi:hypothetical protein
MPGPAPIPAPAAPEGLTAGLAGLACAGVKINAQDGGWALSGFVASTEDFNLVQQLAVDTPNTTLGNVLIARWPQCEALQTLETPLQAAATPAVDIGPTSELQFGDLLRIQIQSPPQISYLYVSYIQADGSVVHLAQPRGLVPQPTLPNQTLVFGDGVAGRTKFVIGAPFGQEMIIALASRSPLFSQELPQQQSERDYLTMLRTALIYKPSPDMPDREVSAAIQILQTRGSAP